MRLLLIGIALSTAAASLMGCSSRKPVLMSGSLDKGLVIVLTGIEGRSPFNEAICDGLRQGGVDAAIQLYDWTSPFPIAIYNQRAYKRNHEKAAEIARWIMQYKKVYPNRPVILVGQSGGAAIAAWTVEALPTGQNVDAVVMLAASLSPHYRLDVSLMRSRRGVVNFYSSRDVLLLGIGTTVTGTMDGEHSSSAGRVGFETPSGDARPVIYNKLYQIAWTPKMASAGNLGIHFSSGAGRFIAQYVAPLVKAKVWNSEFVARIADGQGDSAAAAIAQPEKSAPVNRQPSP